MRSWLGQAAAVLAASLVAWTAEADVWLSPSMKYPGCSVSESEWAVDCGRVTHDNRCGLRVVERLEGACRLIAPAEGATARVDGAASLPPHEIPAGPHELVIETRPLIMPIVTGGGRRDSFTSGLPPAEARHPWFFSGSYPTRWGFNGRADPAVSRAASYAMRLRLRAPPGTSVVGASPPDGAKWRRDGDEWVAELLLAGTPVSEGIAVSLLRAGDVVHLGGPLVGVGGAWSAGEWSLRARAEYEVAVATNLLPGIAVDYDTRAGWLVAPRLELSSREYLRLPMLGLGVGMPIPLGGPARSPGVRLGASLHLDGVGLLFGADLYPGSERASDYSLLLRLSR